MSIVLKPLKFLAMYLTMAIPRNRKQCVFGAWFGQKYADNSKYLYLSMLEERRFKVMWITKSKEVYDELKENNLPVCMYNSLEGIIYQIRSKYVFVCTSLSDVNEFCMGNAVFINLWHGIPFKKLMYDDKKNLGLELNGKWKFSLKLKSIPLRKIYYLPTSRTYIDIYKSAFRVDDNHLIINGQPRNDLFFNSFEKDNINIYNSKKRTIVYLPTHRNSGKVKIDIKKIFDLDKLDSFLKKNKYELIIKKHFYHNNEKRLEESYSNIVDLTGTEFDTQTLIKNADIMITDYSSCYIDYLLLNRPIVFYDYDLKDYLSNDRDMYFKYQDITPGACVETFGELLNTLKEIIELHIDKYSESREKILSFFYDETARENSARSLIEKVTNGVFR